MVKDGSSLNFNIDNFLNFIIKQAKSKAFWHGILHRGGHKIKKKTVFWGASKKSLRTPDITNKSAQKCKLSLRSLGQEKYLVL